MIPFLFDGLTPCLKNVQTGDIVETEVIRVKRKSFISKFNERTGWYVAWSKFDAETEIYALVGLGNQVVKDVLSGNISSAADYIGSIAGGAVSGVIAATGIGLAGQIAINGSIGAGVYISDSVASGKEIDAAGVGEAIGFGMLAGLFGGAGAGNSAVTSQMARMGNRIANAFLNKSGDALKKELGNAFKYYMKNGGGKASVETFKAVLRATLSPIIETTDDTIEKIYNEYMNNLSEQEAQ